jgi:hypothetical protein
MYLNAIEDMDLPRKKRHLKRAALEIETYLKQQNNYSKKMMAILVTTDGKNLLKEIDHNFLDAQTKHESIIRQLGLLEDVICVTESDRETREETKTHFRAML